MGGGAGGLVAAESLRELGFGGKVLIISRESYLPIDRPKLSKSIKVESGKIALRTPEQLAALKIDIMLDSQVTGVDTLQHDVILQDGSKLSFNHLILATGGDPRVLPFPGSELKNIFVMRNVEDSNMIETELSRYPNSKPDVVIIGSSFIGMEAASVLSKLANVTVVGMEKYPFERVLGTEVGKAMYDLNTLNGISLEMEQFVDKYEESTSTSGKVGAVLLKGGKRLKADFVILGAGVVPKTDYLKSSGIKLDKDGGITVHPSMAIPGTNGIYAIGDIARYPYHLTKESVRIEHWDVAQNQGRVAAQSIVSSLDGVSPKPEFKSIPYFWY